jgi:ABC-2 type transport system ATP-binding protein
MMSKNIIEINGLVRRFGKKTALESVTMAVPQGCVMGLVGENGAGKTTLIKHILGLFKAQAGQVRVFDLDPVVDPPGVLGRIGYLSENREMPEWMRIGELIRYTRAYYPAWDMAYARELLETFGLDETQKIKGLSRGQRALTGLLMALAYRPDLLLLDEPSSGLDPVVRRDILAAVVQTIADEGRTVVLSSHLLDEVERVADHVTMIHEGKVVFADTMHNVQKTHCCLTLRFDHPQQEAPSLPGLLSQSGGPQEWTCVCDRTLEEVTGAVQQLGAEIVEHSTPSLDDIFVGRVKG